MKRIVMIIMAAALIALPTMAQQEWQSTSTMQGSGSAYSSQVTAVGATGVATMGATSSAPANAPSGPRRVIGTNPDGGPTNDTSAPLGDAVLPLLLMAAGFGLYTALRRRKETA